MLFASKKPKNTEAVAEPGSPDEAPPLRITELLRDAWGCVDMLVRRAPEAWSRLTNLGETNYQLGCLMVERGDIRDAVMRFKVTLWMNPNHYLAHYNLGCCYLTLGRADEAKKCFRKALDLWADYDEARFMLATLDPKVGVSAMPPQLVINHFAAVADTYEADTLGSFAYAGHRLVFEAAIRHLGHEAAGLRVLDLGCGTGLVGTLFRPKAARIVGVDLSREMLAKARTRTLDHMAIYDELVEAEMVGWLAKHPEPAFDVVTAANVLPYLGDPAEFFKGVARVLVPGGVFAFTAENAKSDGVVLLPGLARFGHGAGCLERAAQGAGLTFASLEPVQLFKDYPAQLGVCTR